MSERVLVTGATGFVGRAVVAALHASGREVLCAVRRDDHRLPSDRLRVAIVPEQTAETLAAAFDEPVDVVVHLAASGIGVGDRDPPSLVRGHSLLTTEVMTAAARWRPRLVVHTGSWSECRVGDGAIDETAPASPRSDYGLAKAAATSWARRIADQHQLPLVTLRLFNVYGPGEALPRLVPSLVAAVRDRTVPSLSSGRAVRDFVFVDDVADAFRRVLDATELPETLNVGTGRGTSVRDVVREFARQADATWLTDGLGKLPDRAEPGTVIASTDSLRRALRWTPPTPLADGVRETLRREGLFG